MVCLDIIYILFITEYKMSKLVPLSLNKNYIIPSPADPPFLFLILLGETPYSPLFVCLPVLEFTLELNVIIWNLQLLHAYANVTGF